VAKDGKETDDEHAVKGLDGVSGAIGGEGFEIKGRSNDDEDHGEAVQSFEGDGKKERGQKGQNEDTGETATDPEHDQTW
jgi:hypothetical protein